MADIIIDGTTVGANRFLLLDSTGKIPAVDGSQVTTIAAGNIATGTIPIARIDTGTTANKIVKLDGNAKLPALDGSLITNVPGATKNASDPTISTNPSGGIGSEWHNTTSGEAYICTDATAGANIWKNVGAGSGNVALWYMTNATTSFFVHNGYNSSSNNIARIDRFSLASDGNGTDWGDLFSPSRIPGTSQSATHGYAHGGYHDANGDTNVIQKFAKASASDSTDVADLTAVGRYIDGFTGVGYGYSAGGYPPTSGHTRIEKYSHTSDANATLVGSIAAASYQKKGNQSETYGYTFGGWSGGNYVAVIDKIAFASDTYSSSIANLRSGTYVLPSATATAPGYVMLTGSFHSSTYTRIDKFATSSDSDSVATGGTLTTGKQGDSAGGSSTTHGYIAGGDDGTGQSNVVEKYSLNISSGSSTDVGDLHAAIGNFSGQGSQY